MVGKTVAILPQINVEAQKCSLLFSSVTYLRLKKRKLTLLNNSSEPGNGSTHLKCQHSRKLTQDPKFKPSLSNTEGLNVKIKKIKMDEDVAQCEVPGTNLQYREEKSLDKVQNNCF